MQVGKSNNINSKIKKFYEKKNNLKDFLKEDEMKTLEKINNCFIDHFIKFFSSFIKNRVELISYNTSIRSCDSNEKIIKNFRCLNLIKILPYNNQSFIIFSSDFLSTIIDILFGGRGNVIDKTEKIKDITSTESLINTKIVKFVTSALSEIYTKYFSSEINFIDKKIFFDFKKSDFDFNTVFLINFFNFNINNIEVFFNILIPISTFKKINKNIFLSENLDNENKCIKKNLKNKITLNDIDDVELNIISKIIDISIPYNALYNLSVGDVLSVKNPNKTIGFIEDEAIFFGNYNRFNEQSIVFIEEFINNNLESN
ncbi:FliM/FliN family flagellar motor switch protein [Buchnera aphidicola]|uniref:FliM/FliN family flagellar motor switch protein n=1 Tax=Buchnera aphidicola TaxID=9 RepID=UPI0002EE9300|nr:FliM/FliN family flagellar motor switch protein [Buchnera aphidicola]